MRYLHPITLAEKFVASGTYTHVERFGVSEQWSIHEKEDGTDFIRLDFNSNVESGAFSIVSEVYVSGGRIERYDLQAFAPHATIKHIRATYSFFDDHVSIGRVFDNAPREHNEIELPVGYIVDPWSVYFTGFVTARMAAALDETHTLVSPVVGFHTKEMFLIRLSKEEVSLVGKEDFITHYYWSNTQCDLWLDPYHTLVKQQFRPYDDKSVIELTRYARRPEPKS